MAQTASLVNTAFNSDDKYSQEIRRLMKSNWLWGFTGVLYVPKKGKFLQPFEEIYTGEGKREEIHHILGRIPVSKLTQTARSELDFVVEKIVKNNILPSRLVFCGSASFPRDIIMNLGLSSPEHESSRTIIQPENIFSSIAQKELSQFNLVNLVYPWIAAKVDKQKAIIGPALILKVFPTVNRV